MPKSSSSATKSPAWLPQRSESWHLTVRKISSWVEMDDGALAHPYLTLLANLEGELVLDIELNQDAPEIDEVQSLLWRAMLKPARELRLPPHRPREIVCDQETLAQALSTSLTEMGVEVRFEPQVEELDGIFNLLEQEFGAKEERLGLLSVPENTPELVGDLFAAAADAFRLAPWIYLNTEQPLKYSIAPLERSGYAQLMGNSAIEYGLLLYESWEDLERSYLYMGDSRPTLPESGWVSLSYVPANSMSPDDLEAIRVYGWPVADPDAYPLPMILFDDHVEPPDQPTLQTFTVLLHALPLFVQALQPDLHGDYTPLELELPVTTSAGQFLVTLQYPAGELRREAFPAMIPFEEMDEGDLHIDDDELVSEDGDEEDETLADWEASPVAQHNPTLVQAMALVYEAWEEIDPNRRIQLCRLALGTSPDCAEAYVLLAEDLAVNLGQALKFYQKGVEAGEHALGQDFFDQFTGEFWQHVEARPYLRARVGLSKTLWELGRYDEALAHCRELMRLDREDTLAAHYAVLLLLLETDRIEEAYRFAHTIDDSLAGWQYTTALLDFQQTGDSPEAQAQLHRASLANRFVSDYLSGRKRLPVDLPPDASLPGSKSEAIDYASAYLAFWRQTPGAIDWLRQHTRAEVRPAKHARASKSGKKKR
jgi:tetratricopeptide (TPR) repeat protein